MDRLSPRTRGSKPILMESYKKEFLMTDGVKINVDQVSQELKIRPEIYLKIVNSFSETLLQKMRDLSAALQTKNLEEMRRILHEIKGTSGNLRLHNIYGPQETLHLAVKANEDADELNNHLEELKTETDKLREYLKELMNENLKE